jgi:hypothetical protein
MNLLRLGINPNPRRDKGAEKPFPKRPPKNLACGKNGRQQRFIPPRYNRGK